MLTIKLDLMLFLNIFYVTECSRRIKDGLPVTTEKKYVLTGRGSSHMGKASMLTTATTLIDADGLKCVININFSAQRSLLEVYLVKAPLSNKNYDSWVCGGALVSSLFIVTSAACVDDVEYLYAIAGYKKYVPDNQIERDPCTRQKKKKVVYTCIPMKYELKYDQLEKWSFIDIALVKVESAYDFKDKSFKDLCSYIPASISINYEPRFQEPGIDGLVFGWGHAEIWRKPEDTANYNQEMLRYTTIKIMDKTQCKTAYEPFANMSDVIDQFMICSYEKGELDEKGQLELEGPSVPKINGCSGKALTDMLMTVDDIFCEENELVVDKTRRGENSRSNQNSSDSLIKNRTIFNQTTETRRGGICQNDHGGPLVTWVGANEVLIGVASVFKITDDSKCMGPYLYTSTQCNGAFLDCILSSSAPPAKKGRRALCDLPPIQRGYDTVERFISWKNHPAGAADNEVSPNVKHVGENGDNETSTVKSKAYRQFVKLKKFSNKQMIAMRPQRPLKD